MNQVLSGWQHRQEVPQSSVSLFGLTVLNMALSSAMTWLEFAAFSMKDAFGNAIGFSQSVVFTAISSLSVFVGITPAALGIRESLLMFSSEILGISPSQALAVSLLDRTINFIVLALFFGFASIYLKKQLKVKVRGI